MLRTIEIEPVLTGFIVKVGCQKLVYPTVEEMLVDLQAYLANPTETERRIFKDKAVNKKYLLDRPQEPPPNPY